MITPSGGIEPHLGASTVGLPAGLVDTHVHTSPDLVPRLMSDREMALAAQQAGYRAIVLKNHHGDTSVRAQLAGAGLPSLKVFGGVVLNEHVTGGLNPSAVDTAARFGSRVVWFPTLTARNNVEYERRLGEHSADSARMLGPGQRGITVLRDGELSQSARDVLDTAAEHELTVATGHLSGEEIQALVPAARAAGVPQVLITHPDHELIGLDVDAQRSLSALDGVWFERVYLTTLPTSAGLEMDVLADAIRAVGAGSTVLASDLGQAHNPSPVSGMATFFAALEERGFDTDDITMMAVHNPARALRLSSVGEPNGPTDSAGLAGVRDAR